MSKENSKLAAELKKILKKGETTLGDAFVKKHKIDTLKDLKFGNIEITSSFLWGWSMDIIDSSCDLDGKSISKRSDVLKKIKGFWDNKIQEISFTDLLKMNILPSANKIEIGNFLLTKEGNDLLINMTESTLYHISLLDDERNIDGLYIDDAITKKRIVDAIHDFSFTKKIYNSLSETKLNTALEKHFKKYFEHVKKSSSSNKGVVDIVLGENNNFGIEMKLARSINAGECQRAMGQCKMYTEEFGDSFMMLIFGTLEEKNNKYVKIVAKECGKSHYYYKET